MQRDRDRRVARAHVAAEIPDVADLRFPLDGAIDRLVVLIRNVDHGAAHADDRDTGLDVVGVVLRNAAGKPHGAAHELHRRVPRPAAVEDHLVEQDFRIRPDGDDRVVDELDLRRALAGGLHAIVLLDGAIDFEDRDLGAACIARGGNDGSGRADGGCFRAGGERREKHKGRKRRDAASDKIHSPPPAT